MTKPLVVSIPHQLGREEAVRRLKAGLGRVETQFGALLAVQEETWQAERLAFRVTALGQPVSGTIDVGEDRVVLELQLPWLLAKLAGAVQPLIRREGSLMLEKK